MLSPIFSILVRLQIDLLREFGSDVERWSRDAKEQFVARIERSAAEIGDDESRDDFFEFHADTRIMYEDQYPQLARGLIWARAYFALEAHLKQMVSRVERKNRGASYDAYKKGQKVALSDTGYASNYIYDIGRARIPCPALLAADPGSPEAKIWKDVNALRVVRNAVVHNDGTVKAADVSVVAASSLSSVVVLARHGRVSFPGPVHEAVADVIEKMSDAIQHTLT